MMAAGRPRGVTRKGVGLTMGRVWSAARCVRLAAAVAVYASSGFYFVDPDEQAVVRWFGRIPEGQAIGPGLRYAPPWPVCRVDTPKTTEMRRAYVGLLPEDREAIARGSLGAIQDSTATISSSLNTPS